MIGLSNKEIKRIKEQTPFIIGNSIKELRKSKNITQTDLGQLTGKDRQYIYKIEKGIVTPNIATLMIIATALATPLHEIFKDIDLKI